MSKKTSKDQQKILSRRSFLRAGKQLSLAEDFVDPNKITDAEAEELFANAPACPKAVNIKEEKYPVEDSEIIQYYISGLNSPNSDLTPRITLAIEVNIEMSPARFVQKVVVTNAAGETAAVFYYAATDKFPNNRLPQMIVSDFSVDISSAMFIFVQVVDVTDPGSDNEVSRSTVYRKTIPRGTQNSLFGSKFPQSIARDLTSIRAGGNPLVVSTSFAHFSGFDYKKKHVSARVTRLESSTDFEIEVDLMHKDLDENNFCRYFIVTDPLGNIITVLKRSFEQPQGNNVSNETAGEQEGVDKVVLKPLDLKSKPYGLASVSDIMKCPYVMVFVENKMDTLARATVKLF